MKMSGDTNGVETKESIRQQIQRHVNCLHDDSKLTRKRGLIDLRKETISKQLGGTLLQELCADVLKPALKCMTDPSEKNRELATQFISDYISVISSPEDTLPYVVVTLVQRLGQQEIQEPAEELRLLILETVLLPCVELSGKKTAGYLDEIVQILQRTIVDPFAEVRKMSCKIASKVSRTIPEHFHMQSGSLVKPLMTSITHQHSKVRVAVIEATSDVIQYGDGKYVDDVIAHLAQRFFDPSAQVRMTVTKVIGRWLLELLDRYSFFHKFIPLILTSFDDEMPDIRAEARRLWHESGILYEQENGADLKDKMDFTQPKPQLYPSGVERPVLGCRELVQRNLSKLTSAIIRDLGDWVVETRVKTSQLLFHLLLHAEEYVTQHMQPLIQALLRSCTDEDPRVVRSSLRSCELVGSFVEPAVFCKMLIQTARSHPASAAPLHILASTISGCSDAVLGDHLHDVTGLLVDPEVCQASEKPEYHQSLLRCASSLANVCRDRIEIISLPLFTVTITCAAMSGDDAVRKQSDECLEELARISARTVHDLYALHTKSVLDSMKPTYETWTSFSVDQQIFNTLISRTGPALGDVLGDVIPMLEANLQVDKDPQLKLTLFTLLSDLLMKSSDDRSAEWKTSFSPTHVRAIVVDMIGPNLTWRAGRVAAAVRSIAVATLWALLRSGLLPAPLAAHHACSDDFLAKLKSALDDDMKTTRLTTAKVLTRLLHVCGPELDTDRVLHNIYMELLKRMDDSSDEIRLVVTKTWAQYFKCFKSEYDSLLYRAHLETMYGGLLVHMDDPDHDIQLAVQAALKEGGRLGPKILMQEIDKVQHKHRTSHYCNQLKEHFSAS